jgi:hypothetical protein
MEASFPDSAELMHRKQAAQPHPPRVRGGTGMVAIQHYSCVAISLISHVL